MDKPAARLTDLAQTSSATVRLDVGDHQALRAQLEWSEPTPSAGLARAVALELGEIDVARLKRCERPACNLVFYDKTRSGTQRWHAESPCGNRERQRRHRAAGYASSLVLKRTIALPPEHVFPVDEWRIVESRFSEAYYARCETVFALSNGYVGVRGAFDEGRPAHSPGVFVNGFHEEWPILHAEEAYGLARTGQTIINVPDATTFRLYVDDEPLFVATARLPHYARTLDMRAGTLTRDLVWETAGGKQVVVRSCRIVSLEDRHLMAVIYEVVLPEDSAPIAISSLVLNRQDVHLRNEPGRGGKVDPRRATILAEPGAQRPRRRDRRRLGCCSATRPRTAA